MPPLAQRLATYIDNPEVVIRYAIQADDLAVIRLLLEAKPADDIRQSPRFGQLLRRAFDAKNGAFELLSAELYQPGFCFSWNDAWTLFHDFGRDEMHQLGQNFWSKDVSCQLPMLESLYLLASDREIRISTLTFFFESWARTTNSRTFSFEAGKEFIWRLTLTQNLDSKTQAQIEFAKTLVQSKMRIDNRLLGTLRSDSVKVCVQLANAFVARQLAADHLESALTTPSLGAAICSGAIQTESDLDRFLKGRSPTKPSRQARI